MAFDIVQRQKIRQQAEMVLHVPGNFTKNILEMAIVADCSLPKDILKENIQELLKTLKSQSEVFRNVRLNMVKWIEEGRIENQAVPIPIVQMGKYFDDYEQKACVKSLEGLAGYLKKFQARSKLIILVTDGNYKIEDREALMGSLNPFLKSKLIIWKLGDGSFDFSRCRLPDLQAGSRGARYQTEQHRALENEV